MTLRPVSLDDKYDLAQSHVFVTGLSGADPRLSDAESARPRAPA